jgi:hypothetical protein
LNARRSLKVVAGAALLFAAWEIIDYVLLASLESYVHSVLSFIIETILAVTAIYWVARTDEQARFERQRSERLAAVAIGALAAEGAPPGPLASLLHAVEEIRESTQDKPQVLEIVDRIAQDARRIQVVNRGLQQAFASSSEG